MLSRRQFVVGGGAAGLGLVTGCGRLPFQQPPPTPVKVHRLGILRGNTPFEGDPALSLLKQALGELGYVEGQNLAIEYRWDAVTGERLAGHAEELVRLPVEVLVVMSVPAALVAHQVSTTVPIVVVGPGDPVAAGLAGSYARPGGNVTGVVNLARLLNSKRLQLLKDTAPSVARVAVFWDTPILGAFPAELWARDAQIVGVGVYPLELHSSDDLDVAFETAARDGADALLVTSSPLAQAHGPQILRLAARLRWPAMYFQRQWVDEGGLMAYDASPVELYQRAADHVDKILRGASPAQIPIEQSMRFDLRVNLKTARELGITLPPEILLQITEVVE